jgi:hypothetical protein
VYPDDRALVAVISSKRDWELVQSESWYRLPVKHAPPDLPDFEWLALYFTRVFGGD